MTWKELPRRPVLSVVHPQEDVLANQPWKQGTHEEKMAKLHPDRRETLEWLKQSYPDRSEEQLLKEMEDWGS
jgi:hypothetical protein